MGMVDALFSTTQQRVLGLLFGQPERSFYASEIIGFVGAGSGAVQRELAKLEGSGLVTTKRIGNQKHFQANQDSPIFDELCSIVLKTVGMVEPIRKALEPLASQIQAAFIFGSVAKRQDRASSDIDLMIVSDTLTLADVFGVLEPVNALVGRQVNPTIYNLADFHNRLVEGNPFVTRVMAQPKTWVIGGAHAIAA